MPTPSRLTAIVAGLTGALGVATGAFGAHGLKQSLTPERLAWWHTGADYHLLHAIVLLAVAVAFGARTQHRLVKVAFWLMVGGIAVFSGSLYAMALTDVRALGAITPIGGTALIAAWVLLAVGLHRKHGQETP
jgi:uncharacterized membrane protein YgdD (TMEM256/DUF423 family)